tara:strand:- start:44 stop:1249 length:1206 start_codon:yes stop_codon:yes gene_type:complete
MALTTVPVELASLDGAVTVNESSADADFRIESNGLSHALFVDGGNDKVIINHTTTVSQAGVAPQFQVHGTGSATSSISATRNSNDTGGPYLILSKSRGTSTGAVTVVQDNDILGQIMFAGADGGDLAPVGASIQAFVDGTPGTNDMPGRLLFSTTADGAEAATERMRIDSTGVLRLKAGTASTGSSAEESYITHVNTGATFLRLGTNYSHNDSATKIMNNTTTIANFFGNGNVEIADGDLVIGTLGHGIDFSATNDVTGSASEVLDDYEEGIFQGAVTGSVGGSMTLSTNSDHMAYTKIGRQVTVTGYLAITGDSSVDGAIRFALPYACDNLADDAEYSMGSLALVNNGSTLGGQKYIFVIPGSYAYLYSVLDDGAADYIKHDDVDTNFQIMFNFSYFAAT